MIRGIWMWPNNIYARGTQKVVSILSKAGFTDIYFLTKGLSGKTSFHGQFAPHAFDRDLLMELLDCAHHHGIRVHAWFTSASDEHYKSLFPESGRAHFKRGKDKGLISFKDKAYLAYLKDIVDEVVFNYPIDGVHLDYIRYNHMLYGWDEKDLSAYQAYGADQAELFAFIEKTFFSEDADKDTCIFESFKNGNKTLNAFFDSRKADVIHFAKVILNGLRKQKPGLVLSAAVMPEGAYQDHSFADLHYGQVYDELSPLFDYLVPMAYSKAYDQNSAWIQKIGTNLYNKNTPHVMGVQAYDHASGLITQGDISVAKSIPNKGYALFREGECAIVYRDHDLLLFNDTPYTITEIEIISDSSTHIMPVSVLPDEVVFLNASSVPRHIMARSGQEDVCVYFDPDCV